MQHRLLFAFVLLVSAVPAQAQQMTPHTITVTGRGEISVTPDYATINMGVMSSADTVAEAAQQNNIQMTNLVAAMVKTGIAAHDIRTSQYTIAPVHPANSNGNRDFNKVSGYEVTNKISVRVNDLGKLALMIDAATQAGANSANTVTFDIQDRKTAEDAAKIAAVKDARHQAEVIAGAEGAKPGPVIAMTASAFLNTLVTSAITTAPPTPAASMISTPIQPGQLRIQSTVTVQYGLE